MPSSYPSLPGTSVEVIDAPPRGRIAHALFDWDGTVSYMRDGWQDFMVPLMVEVLEACPRHEPRADLERLIIRFVDELTGKQTIFQMMRLAEEVEKRGGTPESPESYKAEYYRRLNARVEERYAELERDPTRAAEFLVGGAVEFLDAARARGIRCYLASGTDEEYIRREVQLLGLEDRFDGGIFGALPNHADFSKEMVIRRILSEFDLHGPELLVVGDGYVEILNGRDVGAVRFALVTEEKNRYHMNDDKRGRLIEAGAQLLAPDLTDGATVLEHLLSS